MNDVITRLTGVLQERRRADPGSSYVAGLYAKGLNRILEKVGEESTETILAAKDAEASGSTEQLVRETADLWFHTLVMLAHLDVPGTAVLQELERRFGKPGLGEKSARSE